MIMKKMLYYIFSTFFLLAIMNSCEVEVSGDNNDNRTPATPPTLAGLAEKVLVGDSKLDFTINLTPAIPVTSEKVEGGGVVDFKDEEERNLTIVLRDSQLKIAGGTAVTGGGLYTFTISNVRASEEENGPITFDIAETGSAGFTVDGSSYSARLTNIVATEATADGITLSATTNLSQFQVRGIVTSLVPTNPPTVPAEGVDVEITLSVDL